jgi:assimilatory nitrate reductase electron transfer subunit
MKVVIVGGGSAGTVLAQRVDGAILLAVEPEYRRALLCDLLAGRLSTSDIAGSSAERARVEAIDRASRTVRVAGAAIRYDALVLATGSAPAEPPFRADGVHRLHTLDDYLALRDALPSASRTVVVGGGPLGVETATVLARRGLQVTLVHRHARLLPSLLDAEGAAALRRVLRGYGIRTALAVAATRVATSRRGRVTGVWLDGGGRVDTDLVVLACGTRPRVELARAAGLAVTPAGIAVDDTLGTSDPHIFAVGDCAAYRVRSGPHCGRSRGDCFCGRSRGDLATAWEQATVLADRLAGRDPGARYRGTARIVRLRAGLEVTAAGDVRTRPGDRVVRLADATRDAYQRLVVRGDRIAGLVAVGRHDGVPTLVDWYVRGIEVPASAAQLAQSLAGGI